MLSSAQQAQRLAFPLTSPPFVNDSIEDHLRDAEYLQDIRDIYVETDPDVIGLDSLRRSSDLYSPELNLEAHRTAQEVLIYFHIFYFILIITYFFFILIFNFVVTA